MDDAVESPSVLRLFEVHEDREGHQITRRLTLVDTDGKRSVCLDGLPIYVYETDDKFAEAICIAMLSRTELATDVAIASAFGCHRNTVGRLARRLGAEGVTAVLPARRGPKGPHKVTSEVIEVIRAGSAQMSVPALACLVKERTGVVLSQSHVRRLVRACRPAVTELQLIEESADDRSDDDELQAVRAERDEEDEEPGGKPSPPVSGGLHERDACDSATLEIEGFDPPSVPPEYARGRYMGLALYFPAIRALGLVEAARRSFSLPRSVTFGVRAVTLSLLFMTLLRKPTVESAKHLRRGEFGALVGTDRAPCVKTLRRKLEAMVAQMRATEFGVHLARRWVEAGIIVTQYLYVDGHMKSYSGKRPVQEFYSTKRRLAIPGVHTYFVGDQDGRPLLCVNEKLSGNLAKAMPDIVAAIRQVLGKRKFTVVFDRGGFDHKLFMWLDSERIGFITYQRGEPGLANSAFSRRETRFEGRRVRFDMAEDTAWVSGRGPWRRVVLRATDGHQTPIITNLGLRAPRLACLMAARWRQENLFKYMGAHYGLDQLISYGADPVDPETLIPNPEITRLERQIAEVRQHAAKLKASLGDAVLEKDRGRSIRGLKTAQRGAVGRLRALETEIGRLKATKKALPRKVTVAESGTGRMVLHGEHKAIVDRIKITAYNAEEWLLEHLEQHYPNPNDIRDLLRTFAELAGDIRTTDKGVTVTLDPPDTPIHRRALHGLVADLNAIDATYPGTDIPVIYRVRRPRQRSGVHRSQAVA